MDRERDLAAEADGSAPRLAERHSRRAIGRTILCVLVVAAGAAGQDTSTAITEPVLGLVFDGNSQTLRTLMGIPASSSLGGALGGTPLSSVVISSAQGYALALQADGTAVVASSAGQQALTGVRQGAQQLAVSPGGTAAALYFGDTGKVSVLTGLPNAPQAAREVTLDGPPTLLAVSDDGAYLAAVISLTQTQATVFLYGANSTGQGVLRDRQFVSLEFVPGTSNLVMASPSTVYLYQAAQGLQVVAGQGDGVANVVGAAGSSDGKRVFIVMQSGQVAVWDLAASTQSLLTCSCQPSGMWRLRGKAVFRLNELGAGPLWIVNGDAAQPRIVFVAQSSGGNE